MATVSFQADDFRQAFALLDALHFLAPAVR
jgi:hypothetical protein